jgi:hypothetical protein
MRRQPKPISLSRETLRRLAGRDDAHQLPGSQPTTFLPDHCHTASCKPAVC